MKKYRTKSGMVEEKLPGVNATVNPSEKTQIAMAGGANTLKDVQTILGQEGKRNNLKGQGAKHLVSFNGDEGFGGDWSGGDTGGGDETSDEGFGFTGQQGYGIAGTDDAGIGVSWGAAPPGVEETAAMEDAYPTPTATEKAAATENIGALASARTSALMQQEEEDEGYISKVIDTVEEYTKAEPEVVAGVGFGLDLLGTAVTKGTPALLAAFPPAAALAIAGYAFNKAMNQPKTTEETAAMEGAYPTNPALALNPDPDPETIQYDIRPTPPPDPEGGPDAPKKKKLIRSAANNTTLAIAEEGDLTRDQIRRARRQITRFA
jgi:hypothetical protein